MNIYQRTDYLSIKFHINRHFYDICVGSLSSESMLVKLSYLHLAPYFINEWPISSSYYYYYNIIIVMSLSVTAIFYK